jgi:rhodanese-related sulfurtransferase
MHIHELNPKKTIISLSIFIVVIVIGLLTISSPRLKYKLTPEETIELITWEEGYVFPYELEDVIEGSIDTVILIDIRNNFDFSRGHIPGAENISAIELLNEENIDRLNKLKDDGICVLIYGDTQLHANGPWMIYRQLGYSNVKLLLGGYNYYSQWKDELADTYADDGYLLGTPKHDYADVASNAAVDNNENNTQKKPLNVSRRKKSTVAEGGC